METCATINAFNCRNPLKPARPQHEDETSLNATAAKAERTSGMAHGASLYAAIMGNRQPRPEQGKAQRLWPMASRGKRPGMVRPAQAGEDIVCSSDESRSWGLSPAPAQRTGANT